MTKWFLTMAAAAGAAAAPIGCGDDPPVQPRPPETATMTCEAGWSFTDDRHFPAGWREQAVVAGPVALLRLRTHAGGDFSRPRPVYAKVLLEPRRTATVTVAAADRGHVSLTTHPPGDASAYARGDDAITFRGCAPRTDDSRRGEQLGTGYAIALMIDGPRCATLEITAQGGRPLRRTVGFGRQDCA